MEEERRLLEEGLRLFPAFDKLWLMLGQLEERAGRLPAARTAYQSGLRRCIHRCARVPYQALNPRRCSRRASLAALCGVTGRNPTELAA